MKTDTHPRGKAVIDAVAVECALDLHSAANTVPSALEGHEEPVSDPVDLYAAML